MEPDFYSKYLDPANIVRPGLSPFLTPVNLAGNAFNLAKQYLGGSPTVGKNKPPTSQIQIGAEQDYGPNVGTKVYTGPKYGYQTVDTARTMDPTLASADAKQQDEFRRVQQVLESRFGAKPTAKPPAESKSDSTDRRGPSTTTNTGLPTQPPASQTTDPQMQILIDLIKQYSDPENAAKRAEQETNIYAKRALINSALAQQQTDRATARQVELANINRWKELELERIRANTAQSLAFSQTVAASMLPNQGLMEQMNKSFATAMAPYVNFSLKG